MTRRLSLGSAGLPCSDQETISGISPASMQIVSCAVIAWLIPYDRGGLCHVGYRLADPCSNTGKLRLRMMLQIPLQGKRGKDDGQLTLYESGARTQYEVRMGRNAPRATGLVLRLIRLMRVRACHQRLLGSTNQESLLQVAQRTTVSDHSIVSSGASIGIGLG